MIHLLKNIGIAIVLIFFFVSFTSYSLAQNNSETNKDTSFSGGIKESFKDQAQQQVMGQMENACQGVRLMARVRIATEDFLESIDNIFRQPFIDLQRSNCYRSVIWELDDEVDKLIESYAQAVQDQCVQRAKSQVYGGESLAQQATQSSQNSEEIFKEVSQLKKGISLLRTYGSNGVGFKTEDVVNVYGFEEMSNELYKEVFGVQTDMYDHPYYCPYFQNGNIVGAQIPVLEWHPYYEDVLKNLTADEKKDEGKKRKKILDICRSKWTIMMSSIDSFLIALESGDMSGSYPLADALSDDRKVLLAESARRAKRVIPNLRNTSYMCTDDVVADFVGLVDKIISFKPADFVSDVGEKIIEKQTKARIVMYQNLCNKIIDARKRAGSSLKNLPYYTTIDGIDYCIRPDNSDSTLPNAYQSALNKSLKAMENPKRLDEIALEKMDATIAEVMNEQLSEWAKYRFTYDIAKQRAMYKALYDTGSDGVSTSIQNLMNDLISVIQTTISADPKKSGNLAVPITKSIWDTFYELQERQRCGSCSVKQSDFKIVKGG